MADTLPHFFRGHSISERDNINVTMIQATLQPLTVSPVIETGGRQHSDHVTHSLP